MQTITHTMFLTILAYETPSMCFFSSLVFCDKVEDNLKWDVSGVLISLQFCIPKHSRTFLRYFFNDKYNLSTLRSLYIFILKILLIALKSFYLKPTTQLILQTIDLKDILGGNQCHQHTTTST